jgi:hypothetical protein
VAKMLLKTVFQVGNTSLNGREISLKIVRGRSSSGENILPTPYRFWLSRINCSANVPSGSMMICFSPQKHEKKYRFFSIKK